MFGFYEPIMPAMGFYTVPISPVVIGLPNAVSTATYTFGDSGFSFSSTSSTSLTLGTGVAWYSGVWRPIMPIIMGPIVPYFFFDPMMAYYWMFMQPNLHPQATMAAGPSQPPPPQISSPPSSVSADDSVRRRRSRDAEEEGDKPAAKPAEPAQPAAPRARRGGGGRRARPQRRGPAPTAATLTPAEIQEGDALMQKQQAGTLTAPERARLAELAAKQRGGGSPPPPAAADGGTGNAGAPAAGGAVPPPAAPTQPSQTQAMAFEGAVWEAVQGKPVDPQLKAVYDKVTHDYPEWARQKVAEIRRRAAQGAGH